MVTSNFKPEVEIWPFRACAMHSAIIIGTVRSMWTWLWDRYHVLQNVFLVLNICLQRACLWHNFSNTHHEQYNVSLCTSEWLASRQGLRRGAGRKG